MASPVSGQTSSAAAAEAKENSSIENPTTGNYTEQQQVTAPVSTQDNVQLSLSVNNEKIKKQEHEISQRPYNTEAWITLLGEVEKENNQAQKREAYTRFLDRFPTAGRYWKELAQLELDSNNHQALIKIFTKSTELNVVSVDLWRIYLKFVHQINSGPDGKIITEKRDEVTSAFEYCLGYIGTDRESGPIWMDYIQFVLSEEVFHSWYMERKVEAARALFHRAISIPLLNVEEIWKSYDAFENDHDALKAKKNLGDVSATYMTARSAMREMGRFFVNMQQYHPPYDLAVPPHWSENEIRYLEAWKGYIQWEKSNTLKLAPELLQKRVVVCYRKALNYLRFYPEIWLEMANYVKQFDPKEALNIINQARKALPHSLSIGFMCAELCEATNEFEECGKIYDSLKEIAIKKIKATDQRYNRRIEKLKALQEPLRDDQNQADQLTSDPANGDLLQYYSESDMSGDEDDQDEEDNESMSGRSKEQDAHSRKPDLGGSKDDEMDDEVDEARQSAKSNEHKIVNMEERYKSKREQKCQAYTLVCIMHIRSLLRTEGEKAARKEFGEARKQTDYVTYHLYVASALMEYHVNNKKEVAGKIFSHFFDKFQGEVGFLLKYMEFLIQTGDGQNLRATFEKAVATNTEADLRPLWDLFSEYESNYGKLESMNDLERRRQDLFPEESVADRIVSRYTYFDIDPISQKEFGITHHYTSNVDTIRGQDQQPANVVENQDYEEGGDHVLPKELKNITIGSLTSGRFLNKKQLLTSINPKKYPRPNLSKWESYKPKAQPYNPEEGGGNDTLQNLREEQSKPLPILETKYLNKGDVATYVYEKLGSSSNYEGPRIETDHILNTLNQLTLPPSAFPTAVLQHALGALSSSTPLSLQGSMSDHNSSGTPYGSQASQSPWNEYSGNGGGGGVPGSAGSASSFYERRHYEATPPSSAGHYRSRHSPYDRRGKIQKQNNPGGGGGNFNQGRGYHNRHGHNRGGGGSGGGQRGFRGGQRGGGSRTSRFK